MRLDHLRGPPHRARLDHIWIERALHQPFHLALFLLDAPGFVLEHFDELVTDNLAFLLGIAHARSFPGNARSHRPRRDEGQACRADVFCTFSNSFLRSTPLFTKMQVSRDFALGVAQSAVDEHGSNGRIHSARKCADGPSFANLLRTCSTVESIKCCGVHVGFAPQI